MNKKFFYISFIFLLLSVGFGPGLVSAQIASQQEPPPRGIYVGMSTGQIAFVNSQDRQLYGDSLLIGLKAGYDIFRYLSVEAQARFSGHQTSQAVGNPSGIPTSFLAFQGLGVLRGLYPITRRVSLTGELGGGFWMSDPNQRPTTGNRFRAMATGGLGLQYFLRIRGLAMGIDPQLSVIQDFTGPAVQTLVYLRYTF